MKENKLIKLAKFLNINGYHKESKQILKIAQTPIGTLVVNSMPWGNVFVNNQPKGNTPYQESLTPGSYNVKIQEPSSGAYIERTIQLQQNERKKFIWDFNLKSSPDPNASPDITSGPPQVGSLEMVTKKLTINTLPYSNCWVDGKAVGATPLEIQVTSGNHSIKCVDAKNRTIEQTFYVNPAEQKNIFTWNFDTNSPIS